MKQKPSRYSISGSTTDLDLIAHNQHITLPGAKDVFVTTAYDGRPALGRRKSDWHKDNSSGFLAETFGISRSRSRHSQPQRRLTKSHPTSRSTRKESAWRGDDSDTCINDSSFPSQESSPRRRAATRLPSTPAERERAISPDGLNGRRVLRECRSQPPTPYREPEEHLNEVPRERAYLPPNFPRPPSMPPTPFQQSLPASYPPQGVFAGQAISHQPNMIPNVMPTMPTIDPHWSYPTQPFPTFEIPTQYPLQPSLPVHPMAVPPNGDFRLQPSQYHKSAPLTSPAEPFVFLGNGKTSPGSLADYSRPILERASIGSHQREHRHKENVGSGIARRVQHVHICTGCGKKRSRRYQQANLLRKGEIPPQAYCLRCVREAALSASDTESETGSEHVPRARKGHSHTAISHKPAPNKRRGSFAGFSNFIANAFRPKTTSRDKSVSSADALRLHESPTRHHEEGRRRKAHSNNDYVTRSRRGRRRPVSPTPPRVAYRTLETHAGIHHSPKLPQAADMSPFNNTPQNILKDSQLGEAVDFSTSVRAAPEAHTNLVTVADDIIENSQHTFEPQQLPQRVLNTQLPERRDRLQEESETGQRTDGGLAASSSIQVEVRSTAPHAEHMPSHDFADIGVLNPSHKPPRKTSETMTSSALHHAENKSVNSSRSSGVPPSSGDRRSTNNVEQIPAQSPSAGHSNECPIETLNCPGPPPAFDMRSSHSVSQPDIHGACHRTTMQQSLPRRTRYRRPSVTNVSAESSNTSLHSHRNFSSRMHKHFATDTNPSFEHNQGELSSEAAYKTYPNCSGTSAFIPPSPADDCFDPAHFLSSSSSPPWESYPFDDNTPLGFFGDSADDLRSVLEQKVERQAESGLASAGKGCGGSYTGPYPTASTEIVYSSLTSSLVSIESYDSNEDVGNYRASPSGSYEFVEDSDEEEDSPMLANGDDARSTRPSAAAKDAHSVEDSAQRSLRTGLNRLSLASPGSDTSSGKSDPSCSYSLIAHTGHSSQDSHIDMDSLKERLRGRFKLRS